MMLILSSALKLTECEHNFGKTAGTIMFFVVEQKTIKWPSLQSLKPQKYETMKNEQKKAIWE